MTILTKLHQTTCARFHAIGLQMSDGGGGSSSSSSPKLTSLLPPAASGFGASSDQSGTSSVAQVAAVDRDGLLALWDDANPDG